MPIHAYEAHDLKLSTFLHVTSFKSCKNYSLCRRGNCHWFTGCRELNWFHRAVKGQDMAWDTLLAPYMKMWFYTFMDEFSSLSRKSSTKSDSFLLVKESLYMFHTHSFLWKRNSTLTVRINQWTNYPFFSDVICGFLSTALLNF